MSKRQPATEKTKKSGEKKPRKPHDGLFKPGNTIGMETRAQPGNLLASVYDDKYPDLIYKYCEEEAVLHSFERWCVNNKVDVRTAMGWVAEPEKYPRFASAYAYLKSVQKCELMEKGVTGEYNPQIDKFLLENNHGMREKQESEIKGSAITVNIREVN